MLGKDDIPALIRRIGASLQELSKQKELSGKSRKKLCGILEDIDRLLSLTDTPAGEVSLDEEFLRKAIEVVENELSNPEFSIPEFCRTIGMSRTSVYTKIKALTGQGPGEFIRIIRLKRARDLLALRKHTVGEVSVIVGFSDAKYFSTSFKKQFGVSPSKIK
ncbi:MAG: AraC family transcriptional regulator [Tannerellaceae bacterium]|jgi:AraC-like DNA-binding protein|nr:AraC family transcriptional regulator [Tannerellaceae bacterium]